ncbi:hypothetical protein FRC02_004957 [Tulasnella sp. 418]|nr:hypothetical protein FRC02_004957 [Tulasnella sp. 418]
MSVSHYMESQHLGLAKLNGGEDGGSRPLKDFIVSSGCTVLEDLLELKRRGWDAGTRLDAHFTKLRQRSAISSSRGDERFWIRKMYSSMAEMDSALGLIPRLKPFRFLDLGCAPGGYSTYILEKCINSTGVGITLPVEDGGHVFAMSEKYLQDRYEVHYQDLTTYDAAAPSRVAKDDSPLPFPKHSFDFVILDGHPLWSRQYDWNTAWVLLVSQLLIVLHAVKAGGSLFVKLDRPESPFGARFMYLLDSISTTMKTIKPNTVHGNRGTFYALARGVRLDEQTERFIQTLQDLRMKYELAGEPMDRRGLDSVRLDGFQGLPQSALDSIVPLGLIKTVWLPRLIELGTPVWKVQKEHLTVFLRKKKVSMENDIDEEL